jgi:hypothetical protein
MLEPVAEQVLAAIAARCAMVTVANGYRQTVATVARRLRGIDQFDAFPVVLVLLGTDDAEPAEIGDGAITTVMQVPLVLYDEADAVEPATKIVRLRADLEIALTTPDLHLGLDADVVRDIRRVGSSEVEEVVVDDWHRIQAVDHYRVEFDYVLGAP